MWISQWSGPHKAAWDAEAPVSEESQQIAEEENYYMNGVWLMKIYKHI